MSQHPTARRAALAAAALGLALTATGCGGAGDESVRLASGSGTQGGAAPADGQTPADQAPADQAPVDRPGPAEPAQADPPPAQPQPAEPKPAVVLPDGTYEAVLLSAEDGTVVLDRGRFVLGEPLEPGVDSTAPVTFDTGTAAERLTLPVADDARLVLQVAGVGTTAVPFGELEQAVDARAGDLLATVTVSGDQVTGLEQLYRP